MPDKPWKRFERLVAKFFGTTRKGPMQEKNSNDIKHDNLHVQCKHFKKHAVVNIWDDAKSHTDKTGKIPVVALGVKGRPGIWFLVKDKDLTAVANVREQVIKDNDSI